MRVSLSENGRERERESEREREREREGGREGGRERLCLSTNYGNRVKAKIDKDHWLVDRRIEIR